MNRPVVMVAIAYVCGVIVADEIALEWPLLPLLGLAAVLCVLALAWTGARPWLVWVILILSGLANQSRHLQLIAPEDLRAVIGDEPCLVRVRGTLCETPYQRSQSQTQAPAPTQGHDQAWRSVAELETGELRRRGENWQRASGRILVTTPGILDRAFAGNGRVEIEGVLRQPAPPAADGLFDYQRFLQRQGIHFQLMVRSTNDWTLCADGSKPARPWSDGFLDWGQAALSRGLPEEDLPLRLLWTMTLGWKSGLTSEISEPFMRSGTMHVFAISGLHIALIAGLLVTVLRVLRVPRWLCGLLVIPLAWLYTGLTGWQASAIRSTVMATVILAGWGLRRPSDLLNSLAMAAFIILLWDPQQLFQASFQLSFLVVLSLALFTPVLEAQAERWLAPDPLLPEELRPRWHDWLRRPARHLAISLSVSIAAWLGSLPLIAFYFHLFTPISLLANLVVVPLSTGALACNVAALATNAWCPGITILFNHAAWLFMWLMIRASEWAATTPGGVLRIGQPSLALCLAYYLLLVMLFTPRLRQPPWRWPLVALLASLAVLNIGQAARARSRSRLTVLPLRGGSAVYTQASQGGPDLLVDCGDLPATVRVVKPFLEARGVNRLDGLALTHGAVHSVGAAGLIAKWFAPRHVHVGAAPARSAAYRQQLTVLAAQPGLILTNQPGDRIGRWRVLHPAHSDRFPQADDNALVLLGQVGACRVLLLSTLGTPGQSLLLSRQPGLRADVVISGMPAQTEPVAAAFLEAVNPRVLVLVDAERSGAHRPTTALHDRLRRLHTIVLFTRETGAVTVTGDARGWTVETMSRERMEFSTDPASGPAR